MYKMFTQQHRSIHTSKNNKVKVGDPNSSEQGNMLIGIGSYTSMGIHVLTES